MLYLYNENMWNHLGPLQIHGISSIQLSICQHCITKPWTVFSVYPLLKSASRFKISGKREDTQPCYENFGNSLFPFRQKLGNNTRLKSFLYASFYHCFASDIFCQLIFKIFIPSQLPPKHPRPDHLGTVYQVVSVTLWSVLTCNAWGLIYFFIFEGIGFLIFNDTMINPEVHYMYTFCLFMSTWERSVTPIY